MSYTPYRTVVVNRNRLTESADMTQPVSSFVGKEAYLVITVNAATHSLSIGKMLTALPNFDKSQQIGTAFNSFFNDAFIARFQAGPVPTKLSSGLYNKRLSVFNPFAYQDFEVSFTSINTPNVKDDVTQKGFLDDLAISKPGYDLSQCLVAVNGVFHKTAYLNNVLYVLDGFRTIRLTGRKDVVIVDTHAIGGHTIIPLTTQNVGQCDWQKPALVTLDNSIAGKSVFAVIDGFFYHREHDVLQVVDNKHLRIDTAKTCLIQQFRHNPRTVQQVDILGNTSQQSRKYTDDYALRFLNRRAVPTADLETAAFQRSRLTAFHSFLVVMNNPNLYTVSVDILPTGTPQFYIEQSKRNIAGMLNYGCGFSPSYLIWKDAAGRKSIFLPETDYDADLYQTTHNPVFIPNLITSEVEGAQVPARFIDYVCG